jgi:SAM-dependent methyltransferase
MDKFLKTESTVEEIVCPFCAGSENLLWARENGFSAVKCSDCGLVYVNPRPIMSLIDKAVKTGRHSEVAHGRTVIGRRVRAKVKLYKRLLAEMFVDVWGNSRIISWLDVGAGYGEVVEAVSALAPTGSRVEGLEPMEPKAVQARDRGLTMIDGYLSDVRDKFNFISLVNVFSHIPDFRLFLAASKNVLFDNGELFIETGNIGDIVNRNEIPAELDLPDHLVFAGEDHIAGYLREAGFGIVDIKRRRKDGITNCVKNVVKRIMGREVNLSIPYTSSYRTLLFRARLDPAEK